MKLIKSLVLLGVVLSAGCGSGQDHDAIIDGGIDEKPSVELPHDENPQIPAPAPLPPKSDETLSVGCVWEYDEEPLWGPPCNPETIELAIDNWNAAAQSLGLEDLFQYQPLNKAPQIMLFMAYYKAQATDYQNNTGIKTALVQGGAYNYWEYIARALGFAIGLPVNEDENSIMKSFLQIDEYGTLGGATILQSDIDALDELF